MYNIFKNVIASKSYDVSKITNRINKAWAEGSITESERDELVTDAQNNAGSPTNEDIIHAIRTLDERVKKLEQSGNTNDNVEEFVKGRWYYRGDKVRENGAVYVCVAPEGYACTHSPSEYAPFWEVVNGLGT